MTIYDVSPMTFDELLSHFRTVPAAAAALSRAAGRTVPRQTIHRWRVAGSIPLDQQIEFEKLTAGQLRADLSPETRALLGQTATVANPTPERTDA